MDLDACFRLAFGSRRNVEGNALWENKTLHCLSRLPETWARVRLGVRAR